MLNKKWLGLWAVLVAAAWLLGAAMVGAAEVPMQAPMKLGREGGPLPLGGHARVWLDESGARTIDQVAAAGEALPWKAYEPERHYVLGDRALWIQFDAISPPGTHWYLLQPEPGVDLIQLWWRHPDGSWVMQESGERLSVEEWPVPGRVPALELASDAGTQPVRYWVRFERKRLAFGASLQLQSLRGLLVDREQTQLLLGSYFGVLLFLAAASAVSALVYRDRKFGAFAVYIAGIGAWQLVNQGIGAQHVWSDWPHWTAEAWLIMPGIGAAAALWFIKVIAEPARFSRSLDLACASFIAAELAAVAVNAFVSTHASQFLVVALIGAGLPLVALLLLMVALRKTTDPYVRLIAVSFAPVLVMALFPVAHALDIFQRDTISRDMLAAVVAMQMPIIYYALSRRATRRRETGVRAAELSHTDALTGLWDRDTLVARLDDALQRALQLRHHCAVMNVRLTNHETLEEELGREIADRALVVAASIVRGAASDNDLAARIGEHDFALLLDGPTTGPAAIAKAQQIVAQGLQHSPVLPPATTLRFHVATALLPDHELDANRCLQWLGEACNAMRADPRRAIRSLNF